MCRAAAPSGMEAIAVGQHDVRVGQLDLQLRALCGSTWGAVGGPDDVAAQIAHGRLGHLGADVLAVAKAAWLAVCFVKGHAKA